MDISVIVPTHKRGRLLKECLDSIFSQSYPGDKFEVIVVMDGNFRAGEGILREFANKYNNFRYFIQKERGPASARNLGAEMARGEILGYTDDDCRLDRDWIRNVVSAHQENRDIMVIGGLTEVRTDKINTMVSQFLANGAIKTLIGGKEEVIFFPTCNVSYKKELLKKERFNELFPLPAGEDLEYFWRLFKKGYRYLYREDIKVFHDRRTDLKSFLKQAYMYGRGNYLTQYLHRDHPLLKELKTDNDLVFVIGMISNIVKIPRFSYLMAKRLMDFYRDMNFPFRERLSIYVYFFLHKVSYIIGNLMERLRIKRMRDLNSEDTCKDSLNISHCSSVNLKREEKIPAKPDFIILDITHRCNLKCNVCDIRRDRLIKEFTTDEVKSLLRQSMDWGIKEFVLSGGEPFVRDDIFEIFDFVRENKYRIGILTNGILLDRNFVSRLLPYLASNSLSLSISLDAITPKIHDNIRGERGSFERTVRGLRILSELKQRYPNINFNVISIILDENLEELLNLAEFLKSLNVNSIQFQPLLSNNLVMKERSRKIKYWIPEERFPVLDRVVDRLIEFKKMNPDLVINSLKNLELIKKYFRATLRRDDINCFYATRVMLIANNGDVTTCFNCYGNVRRSTLRDIWYSKKAEEARERVKFCEQPCLLPCFTDGESNLFKENLLK